LKFPEITLCKFIPAYFLLYENYSGHARNCGAAATGEENCARVKKFNP
jgi:hypothetical protein